MPFEPLNRRVAGSLWPLDVPSSRSSWRNSFAFVCRLGLTRQPHKEHAAYIANWLDALTADNHAIVTAASHAQRATDFINCL